MMTFYDVIWMIFAGFAGLLIAITVGVLWIVGLARLMKWLFP